jgi:hypothetical protein
LGYRFCLQAYYREKILLQNLISCNLADHSVQGFHKVAARHCKAMYFVAEAISAAANRLLHPANSAGFAMTFLVRAGISDTGYRVGARNKEGSFRLSRPYFWLSRARRQNTN